MPYPTQYSVPNAKLLAEPLTLQDLKLEHAPCVSPVVRGKHSKLVKKSAKVHSLYRGVDGGIDVDEGLTCIDVEVVTAVVICCVTIC